MNWLASIMRSLSVALLLLSSTAASAEPLGVTAEAPAPMISVGARIGGSGFRREGDTTFTGKWDDCRMNGVGVFAQKTVRGPLFAEAALDTYFSTADHQTVDLPIDRQSVLISAAIGARSNFTSWLDGYVQLGMGAEMTKVSVPYGDDAIRDDKVMPWGFLGVGGELKLGPATRVGATIRTLVMGNFNYDPARLDKTNQMWTSTPTADQVFAASPSLATQMQFFLVHDL
ncbi:MAG: outer membrane beta-barrel protein [Kofleriaceae bacterium]